MRGCKLGFIAVFFALTLLPGIQMLFRPFSLAIEEKRRLEPPPPIVTILREGNGRLSDAINRWFDDHVGFRPLLIKLKNQIDYSVFSYSDKVFIGSAGWLYLRSFFETKVAIERRGEELQRQAREGLSVLAEGLERRNIKLVLVANPIKETVVREHQPIGVPQLPVYDQFQRFREALKQQTGWIYIDGQDLLQRPCTSMRTFQLIDLHLTVPGNICFAREVVDTIARAEGRTASPWHHTYNYRHVFGYDGAQAEFLGIFSVPGQPVEYPDRSYGWDSPQSEGSFELPSGQSQMNPIFEWAWHAREPARAEKLPPIVLFGNSFLDYYPFAGFASYFQDVYRVREHGRNLKTALDQVPPGTVYFVLQFLETDLFSFAALTHELR